MIFKLKRGVSDWPPTVHTCSWTLFEMFSSWWGVHWAQRNCYLATTKCKALTLEPTSITHEDELTVQFSVIKRFELFFQLFNLKMWDKKLPVSSLPKNAFLVESSTLLHSVAQTHHEWAPRQLWGATDTYFKRSIPLPPYLPSITTSNTSTRSKWVRLIKN